VLRNDKKNGTIKFQTGRAQMFEYFTETLPHFLAYFAAAIALAVAFLLLYVMITPHKEISLIREGNSAAALQLTGTFLGFTVPVAIVIGHSVNIPDMLLWGAVAALVQLIVFFVISRLLFTSISKRIAERCVASGVFVGGMGLGTGILQAAGMVPGRAGFGGNLQP
jgi:putative membrane protein